MMKIIKMIMKMFIIIKRQQQQQILPNTINHYDEDCHNLELNIHWILDTTQAKATTTKKTMAVNSWNPKHLTPTLYLPWHLTQLYIYPGILINIIKLTNIQQTNKI